MCVLDYYLLIVSCSLHYVCMNKLLESRDFHNVCCSCFNLHKRDFYDTIVTGSKTRSVPGLLKSDVHRKSGGSFETGYIVMEEFPVQRISFLTTNGSYSENHWSSGRKVLMTLTESQRVAHFHWYVIWICATFQAEHDTISCTE